MMGRSYVDKEGREGDSQSEKMQVQRNFHEEESSEPKIWKQEGEAWRRSRGVSCAAGPEK